MKRLLSLTVAALGALSFSIAPAATADVMAPWSEMVWAGSSQGSSDLREGADNAWRQGYNALPPQIRAAVPREFRPSEPAEDAAPPAETVVVSPAEPTPSPDTCANCVALTFDDGPVGDTDRLLDILKAKQAHASFFVVGTNAHAFPQIMQRMRDEGHTVGNHTYNHPDLQRIGDAAIGSQLDDTTAAIGSTTGLTPRWMRPPYGSYDARVTAASGNRGMAVAIWDVDTADWSHRNTQTTCSIAVNNATPGSVILMHDIHRPTVDAVECILDGLREKNLRAASLDEMIKAPEAGYVYTHRP